MLDNFVLQAVNLPWGDFISTMLQYATPAVIALGLAVFHNLATPVATLFINDQAISDAINFALSKVEGAVAGNVLSVGVANKTLDAALQYVVKEEPKVAKQLGTKLLPQLLSEMQKMGLLPPEFHV